MTSTDSSPSGPPIRRTLPIHPLFVAAFPILALYSNNQNDVRLHDIWRPLALSILGAAAAWIVLSLLFRNMRKAAAAASLLSLTFFSYGHVANLLAPNGAVVRGAVMAGYIAGVLVVAGAILRSRKQFNQATRVLNFASVVLILPSAWSIGSFVAYSHQMESTRRTTEEALQAENAVVREPVKKLSPSEAALLPDIYYIILDAYAGSENLVRYFGFDNSKFVHELEKRGFWIARRSRSNYHMTGYSLCSSLNMRHLDRSWVQYRPTTNVYELLRKHIDENEVAQALRRRGYQYVSLGTGTEQARVDTSDIKLDKPQEAPGSFERQALGLTGAALSAKLRTADFDKHRSLIEQGFHELSEAPALPTPKFVFAHFSAPHPPFVFGPKGEAVYPEERYSEDDGSQLMLRLTKAQYRTGYVAQVQYMSKRILAAIDALLRTSRRPPIILLQGDHGSRMKVVWESLERTDLGEPYPILNAYLVPPSVRSRLYDGISPVNSFRALMDGLFDTRLGLLPDRSYFSLSTDPLNFQDVTDRLPR